MADPTTGVMKKKPALDLVIETGKGKGLGDEDDATTEEDESSEDSTEAAGEVFDMIEAKDRVGFVQAMKALIMSSK